MLAHSHLQHLAKASVLCPVFRELIYRKVTFLPFIYLIGLRFFRINVYKLMSFVVKISINNNKHFYFVPEIL
jgi:hypothetical protein